MTAERKIVFGPSDVERIEFTCKACGAILALNPSNEKHHIQRDCPNCGNEWMIQESVLHQASVALLKSLRTLAQMDKEAKSQVRLCLRGDEPKMKTLLAVLLLSALSFGQTTTTQDADALEAQYSTCEKHHIPADKCTPEIYRQLKAKDNAPLDPNVLAALRVVKEYQATLKSPESMQVRTVYILDSKFLTDKCKKCGPDDFVICLEIGAQNGAGGTTVSYPAVSTFQGKEHWHEGSSFGGVEVSGWNGVCTKPMTPFHPNPQLFPGTDVTEKVNQALKRVSQ